jgi:hypothetical protein
VHDSVRSERIERILYAARTDIEGMIVGCRQKIDAENL